MLARSCGRTGASRGGDVQDLCENTYVHVYLDHTIPCRTIRTRNAIRPEWVLYCNGIAKVSTRCYPPAVAGGSKRSRRREQAARANGSRQEQHQQEVTASSSPWTRVLYGVRFGSALSSLLSLFLIVFGLVFTHPPCHPHLRSWVSDCPFSAPTQAAALLSHSL